MLSLILCGCSDIDILHAVDREIFGPRAVNDFIDLTGKDPGEITELVCDPGEDTALSASHFDKLGKLEKLESVTFVGISSEEDTQDLLGELTKLDKLRSLTIKDSRVGSVSKLKDMKSLEEVHLTAGTYSGKSYKIGDLEELTKIRKLKVLDLQNVFPDTLPDLREAEDLEDLTLSSYDISEIPYETANWSKLKRLSFYATGISRIDDRIIKELDSLESLDISYSKIEDVTFVHDLPCLKEFKYRQAPYEEQNP